MRKKNYAENSDDENEFDVDEPEAIQNNASDDDWTPDKAESGSRRTSTRLRNIPKSRAPIIDASSTDEEGSDSESSKRKAKGKGRPPAKKAKVSSTSTPSTPKKTTPVKSTNVDSEPSSTTVANNSNSTPSVDPAAAAKINKDFTSGAFIVLKTDVAKLDEDPPLWKIDGKALLQKYIPFQQDGQTLYKNTSVYSGWTVNNKNNYFPVQVIFKQQTRKDHIVEFKRDQIKKEGDDDDLLEVSSSVPEVDPLSTSTSQVTSQELRSTQSSPPQEVTTTSTVTPPPAHVPPPVPEPEKRPLIKVKSFAIVPQEESNTPAKPLDIKAPSTPTQPMFANEQRINKNYTSGAFLVLRSEAANVDPPLWKIDGKSLLQKYCAFNQDGVVLYKNCPEYSGWSLSTRNLYFPVSVIFKRQDKTNHIVQLERIKWDEVDNDPNK